MTGTQCSLVYSFVKKKIIHLCPEIEEQSKDNVEATQETAMEFLFAEMDT